MSFNFEVNAQSFQNMIFGLWFSCRNIEKYKWMSFSHWKSLQSLELHSETAPPVVFNKTGAYKNFAEFTAKHLSKKILYKVHNIFAVTESFFNNKKMKKCFW